jgi:DNA-binding protein YbaB
MDADQWLASYQQRIDDIQARAAAARRALAGLTATAVGERGAVTVTVNPAGALCGLTFGERADELSRPQLAQAVLDAARRAHADAARRSQEALAPLIGADAAERALGDYRPAGAGS